MSINFPTSLDTDATLHQMVNNLSSTLTGAYTSPGSTLDLADASAFPATGGILYCGGERGTWTGKTANQLTGVAGLTNNYSSGTTVEQLLDAAHHNDLRDAVKALEAKVGIDSSAVTTSHDYKIAQKPGLTGSNPVALGAASPGVASDAARSDHVHPTTGLELTANKATGFGTVNDTLYPTVQAVKTYADALVVGLLDDRGSYNASVNTWPASGGSGTAGAILKGDLWYISVAGTLGGTSVSIGDTIRVLSDTPGQTASNWDIIISPVSVAGQIHAATSKTTPVDADELGLIDSAASWVLKKLTWANLKATFIATAHTWSAAQTFRAASAVRSEAAATQDAMILAGRAGGTSSYAVTLTPTTLTASRTVTFPDAATSIPVASYTYTFSGPTAARTYTLPDANASLAILGANTFTAAQALGNNNITGIKTATFNGEGTIAGTTGAQTVDWTAAQNYKQTEPTGIITYTFTAPPGVCHLQLRILSDGTSTAYTHVWPATVKWLGATWAAVANKNAVINFWYDGTDYWAMGANAV